MIDTPPDEEWRYNALCAQVDPEMFFPEKIGGLKAINEAKRACRMCPIRGEKLGGTGECLEYALTKGERFGVWGGYSERERRKMNQRRREGAA